MYAGPITVNLPPVSVKVGAVYGSVYGNRVAGADFRRFIVFFLRRIAVNAAGQRPAGEPPPGCTDTAARPAERKTGPGESLLPFPRTVTDCGNSRPTDDMLTAELGL